MQGRLNIGKNLIGDGSEVYFPFASSQVRYMASNFNGYYLSKTIKTDDGFTILLEVMSADSAKVTIWGEGSNYEFFTTSPTLSIDESNGLSQYRGYGVKAKFNNGAGSAMGIALGSTLENGAWKYSTDPQAMSDFLDHKDIFQVQGIVENVFYPSNADGSGILSTPYLVNSWTTSNQTINLGIFSGRVVSGLSSFDIQYDVAPSYFKANSTKKPDILAPDSDWYKKAAIRTVKNDTYGDRIFVILTDISNKFYAYPLTTPDPSLHVGTPYDDQEIKTTVPDSLVNSFTAPFPAWVRLSPLQQARDFFNSAPFEANEYLRRYPQYRFSFNSKADKCCAIVFRDFDVPTFQSGPFSGQTINYDDNGHTVNCTDSLPGIVEFDIALDITGPELSDFTFSLSLSNQLNPAVTGKYYVAVDYAWPIDGIASQDDMVVISGDFYYKSDPDYSVFQGWVTSWRKSIIKVENLTRSTVIKQFVSSKNQSLKEQILLILTEPVPEVQSIILAYDLRILAFVFQHEVRKFYRADTFDYEVKKAVKLDTWAYGQSQKIQHLGLDSDLNDYLDLVINDIDVSSYTRYSPNAVGNNVPTPETADYDFQKEQYFNPASAFFSYRLNSDSDLDIVFNTGALVYLDTIQSLIMPDYFGAFTVHPEGHWSISTAPTFYYEGPMPSYENEIHYHLIDISLMRQDFVDIVNFASKNQDGVISNSKTTHVDLYNAAYGKSITKNSYFYKFLIEEFIQDVTDTFQVKDCYIKVIKGYNNDILGYFLYSRLTKGWPSNPSSDFVEHDGGPELGYRIDLPVRFDAKVENPAFIQSKLIIIPGFFSYENFYFQIPAIYALFGTGPTVRGASIMSSLKI